MILILLYLIIRLNFIKTSIDIEIVEEFTEKLTIHPIFITTVCCVIIITSSLILSSINLFINYYLTPLISSVLLLKSETNNDFKTFIIFRILDYIIYKYILDSNVMFLFLVDLISLCNI